MYAPLSELALQLTGTSVLQTFQHDELSLFLGAAFTSVGLIALGAAFLDRRFNALLFWFALFVIFYGQRMWLESGMMHLLLPPAFFWTNRFIQALSFLVPIPAFYYFKAAGYLTRAGQKVVYAGTLIFLCLFFSSLSFGRLTQFDLIDNIIVLVMMSALCVEAVIKKVTDRMSVLLRRGLLAVAACVAVRQFGYGPSYLEPLGFIYFFSTLGYVAARRSIDREQQFGELQKELDVARRIQTGNLPSAFPNSANFRVASRYVPMTAVAGDFYDFLVADDQHAGLLVADVSGHGVPAALIASMVKLAAITQRANAADPAALLTGLNASLCGNTHEQFVTAAYVYLDATTNNLHYAAAGHPPMLLMRKGQVIQIVENGLMLAAFTFAAFTTSVRPLEAGDRLLLYTDGIVEAADARKEEFGQSRLQNLLLETAMSTTEQTADTIIDAVQQWSATQDDDLTVIVCDYAAPAS